MDNIHNLHVNEDTLVICIEQGRAQGYKEDFKFESGRFVLEGKHYKSNELNIDLQKRFEGMTNPADEMIYFRISTIDGKKGYYVSAYGIHANHEALLFLQDVTYEKTMNK